MVVAVASVLSTSICCSSVVELEALPFGDAFAFFEALTGGDGDAPRFFPAPVDACALLRGDGVLFLLLLTVASSSSSSTAVAEGTAAVSLTSSVALLTVNTKQRIQMILIDYEQKNE